MSTQPTLISPQPLDQLEADAALMGSDDRVFAIWDKAGVPYLYRLYMGNSGQLRDILGVKPPAILPTATVTATLKVRSAPGVTQLQIGTLYAGDIVTLSPMEVPQVVGDYRWRKILTVKRITGGVIQNLTGWVADQWLQLPPPPKSAWKMGVHVIGKASNSSKAEDLAITMKALGRPLPVVVVTLDPMLANRIKTFSPETFVVSRFRTLPYELHPPDFVDLNGKWSARLLWERFWPELKDGQGIVDAFQFANEWLPGLEAPFTEEKLSRYRVFYEKFCQWYYELAAIAKAEGFRCTIGDFGVGHPFLEDPAVLRMTTDLLDAVCSLMNNVGNYHAYSGPANDSMKTDQDRYAMKWVKMRRPGTKWLLSECGWLSAELINQDKFVQLVTEVQQLLQPYDDVIGAGLWSLGAADGEWRRGDWSAVIPAFIELMKT